MRWLLVRLLLILFVAFEPGSLENTDFSKEAACMQTWLPEEQTGQELFRRYSEEDWRERCLIREVLSMDSVEELLYRGKQSWEKVYRYIDSAKKVCYFR